MNLAILVSTIIILLIIFWIFLVFNFIILFINFGEKETHVRKGGMRRQDHMEMEAGFD